MSKNKGLTLIELMIAMGISVVIGGVSLMLTRTSLDTWKAQGESNEALETCRALLDRIIRELHQATSITSSQAHSITFTIPDHTGDLQPETISFSWAGIVGEPVYRSENGLTPEIWAQDVKDLNFTYQYGTRYSTTESYQYYDIDILVNSFAGYDPLVYQIDEKDRDITSSKWSAEVFSIGEADKLKTVTLRIKGVSNPAFSFYVEIRPTVGGGNEEPGSQVLSQMTVTQAMISPDSFNDVTFDIPDVTNINPNKNYCIVVRRGSGSEIAGKLRYQQITGPGKNPKGPDDVHNYLYSDDSGKTWKPGMNERSLYDLFFTVDGSDTYTTVQSQTISTQVIESVKVTLEVMEQLESVRLTSEVKLPNI